jgi:SAM-dependent methyltransferase
MKVLIIGSNKDIEDERKVQHGAVDEFGVNIERIYMDIYGAEIKHNINNLPYPFKKNQFDSILLSHVLEHANPQTLIEILKEIHRITKPLGKIIIYVPHFSSSTAFSHITHFRSFGVNTFNPLCDNIHGWERYIINCYELVDKKIIFPKRFSILNSMPKKFYNIWENWFNRLLPAHEIKFQLMVKPKK